MLSEKQSLELWSLKKPHKKNILIGFTRQEVFANGSFASAKAERNNVGLVQGEDKRY